MKENRCVERSVTRVEPPVEWGQVLYFSDYVERSRRGPWGDLGTVSGHPAPMAGDAEQLGGGALHSGDDRLCGVLDMVLHVRPLRRKTWRKREKDPSPDSNPFQPKKLFQRRDPLGNAIAEPHDSSSA